MLNIPVATSFCTKTKLQTHRLTHKKVFMFVKALNLFKSLFGFILNVVLKSWRVVIFLAQQLDVFLFKLRCANPIETCNTWVYLIRYETIKHSQPMAQLVKALSLDTCSTERSGFKPHSELQLFTSTLHLNLHQFLSLFCLIALHIGHWSMVMGRIKGTKVLKFHNNRRVFKEKLLKKQDYMFFLIIL